jgi:hypothetical protein
LAYDIFDENGYYAFQIWSGHRPGLVKDGKMYRMDINRETGYRVFKRYQVIWAE